MNPEAPAWCGGCGLPLARIHGTAYVRCCSLDYWSTVKPLPRDWMNFDMCKVGDVAARLYIGPPEQRMPSCE